jgi:hypothetical protein
MTNTPNVDRVRRCLETEISLGKNTHVHLMYVKKFPDIIFSNK